MYICVCVHNYVCVCVCMCVFLFVYASGIPSLILGLQGHACSLTMSVLCKLSVCMHTTVIT